MGTEGDRLILDYLSKVGDLAQTAMPARERAQLVARLRDDIDRQRRGGDSPAAVRRILGRLGSPDEVVGAAGQVPARRDPGPPLQAPPVQAPRAQVPAAREPGALEPGVPAPRAPEPAPPPEPADPADLEKPQRAPLEWWRAQPRRRLTLDEIAALPGVTIPREKPEPKSGAEAGTESGDESQTAQTDQTTAVPENRDGHEDGNARKPRVKRRWPARKPPAPAAGDQPPAAEPVRRRRAVLGGLGGAFMETLAALALLAGAVSGLWPALLIGWVLAYYSRRLSPREARFAALGLPGTVFAGTVVWLWGRIEGRWGEPLAQGRLGAAIGDAFPWTVRIAAVGSALFVLWRSRRRTAS